MRLAISDVFSTCIRLEGVLVIKAKELKRGNCNIPKLS